MMFVKLEVLCMGQYLCCSQEGLHVAVIGPSCGIPGGVENERDKPVLVKI